ncbi:N-myc-interactor-like isoform 2-T2 [Salvelinus alpinus]
MVHRHRQRGEEGLHLRSEQRITGGKLPALQDTYTTRCHRKAKKIIKDNNHPSHCLLTPLSSRRRESLALKRKYSVDVDREVNVGLVYSYQLKKFLTFCGTPKRTILLNHIEDTLDEEDLRDYLEIHFQNPSNYGGELECIKHVSRGKQLH